jgi:hypothetical protein
MEIASAAVSSAYTRRDIYTPWVTGPAVGRLALTNVYLQVVLDVQPKQERAGRATLLDTNSHINWVDLVRQHPV